MQPGDLLLTETAADYVHRVDAAVGRLCVVAVHGTNTHSLARVFSESRVLYAELYSRHALTMEGSAPAHVAEPPYVSGKRRRRRVTAIPAREDTRSPDQVEPAQPTVPQAQRVLPGGVLQLASVEDIVGVCLLLERPNLLAAKASQPLKAAVQARQEQSNCDFDKIAVTGKETMRVKE